ncbi:ELM1/GtrOC1 family putative glycosyltransferase [Acetobacter indonesiensis]|nr:ELM1/GtrOC1 family putative glycosyltransferase [Acetobacter indonesiensis]MCP1231507.1 mitochondrial fission ELM1 family protein [Acetobacter indonesiensis]
MVTDINVAAPVWVLDTGRAGEMAQCLTLAQALGLPYTLLRLGPEFSVPEVLPDITGVRVILSFGNAVQAALALRDYCTQQNAGCAPAIVHIGRPSHVPVRALDLIIILPQDDYPSAPNVLRLAFPLNAASLAQPVFPTPGGRCGGTVVVYGAPTKHFSMTLTDMQGVIEFAQTLAVANQEPLHVLTSPRTPADAVEWLRAKAAEPASPIAQFSTGSQMFQQALATGNRFVVTGDSASMVAETCRTGAPVWLYELPPKKTFFTTLQTLVDILGLRHLRYALVKMGVLGSGADFARWHAWLVHAGYVHAVTPGLEKEELRWQPVSGRIDRSLKLCRDRILALPQLAEITGQQPPAQVSADRRPVVQI